ncbi:hypothetical protein C8R45DRAFT_923429 [Mycena sanguinolenta]|nr:hypothetical protein C8R45DRAFT_923429 [Mycena sanguinolenta]
MPRKPKHLRNRANNFIKHVRDVIEHLSPRKRRRCENSGSDKENAKGSTSPSVMSADVTAADPITEDVFLTESSHVENSVPGLFPSPYGSFFYRNASPDVSNGPLDQFYHEYSLNEPRKPSKYRPTVEEVPDEDDLSFLAAKSTTTLDSLESITSAQSETPPNDTADCAKAAAGDPETQNAYANIYDVYIAPGRLREAPSIASAAAAVKDLMLALRGESRGVCGGYKDHRFDPFVRVRLEGMRTFLNVYTDTRSKTYSHWAASALQAAVSLGKGTHCLRTLCKLARQYIHDRTLLPFNPYGEWQESLLADEGLRTDINLYLQEISNDITAEKLVQYLARPDFVSVDFGWSPTSLDGKRTARRFLKPGKGREGYLTCEDVVQQASDFMDIFNEVYPEFEHHLVYDNATTHRKRPDGALSARAMSKGPSKSLETNFGVTVNDRDAITGKPIYATAGKLKKIKIPIFGNRSAKFADAYAKGLNGRQAAWAARKYHGHRIIPESILEELEAAGID